MTRKFLINVVLIVAVLFIIIRSWKIYQDIEQIIPETGGIIIATDKKEYRSGELLRLTIKNNFAKNVCFSSCYPYFLEKKDEKKGWKSYKYQNCPESDVAEKCMEKEQIKAFMTTLPKIKKGIHRIRIPCCIGCKIQQDFKESKRFYSNEFKIE